ncbi:MAG: protein kinase [Byssovorax sp.]
MIEKLTTPGSILLGKYRVERVIGKGAMGFVIAATHLGFDQQVAMKFMLPGNKPSAEGHARFLREARIAARLTTHHIAKVLDVGIMDDGITPYLVMEMLAGTDLAAVLDTRGPLPVSEAVGYVLQVCEAAAEAHKAGIVHRDLKPANLFLATLADGSPCVKVLDFGVSKLAGGVDLTSESAIMGTPLYMPPEQLQASKEVDGRADIWALGVILYELLAGITPFHADQIQVVCGRIFQGEPTPLSKFLPAAPPSLEGILMKCFEKDREQRWQNVAEFAAALAPLGAARDVVHAERAAAILGVSITTARLTDLLPPEVLAMAPPQRAPAVSEGISGTLSTVAAPSATVPRSGSRRGSAVAAAFGLVALAVGAMASVILVGRHGPSPDKSDPTSGSMSTPEPSVVAPTAAPSSTAPPIASTVLAPETSATPSATVGAPPPHGPTPHRVPPPPPTVTAKPVTPGPKKNVLERG